MRQIDFHSPLYYQKLSLDSHNNYRVPPRARTDSVGGKNTMKGEKKEVSYYKTTCLVS